MGSVSPLLWFLMMIAGGWVHRHQLIDIEFLQAENRLLKERLRGRRIRFDSLSLLHGCMRAGLGATIEPMGAGLNAGKPNCEWRYLPIRDAKLTRRSYIFAIETEMLSSAVPIVAAEIKETVRQLISSGTWPGVRLL